MGLGAYNIQSIAVESTGPGHPYHLTLARNTRFREGTEYGDGEEATLARGAEQNKLRMAAPHQLLLPPFCHAAFKQEKAT